jgi:hypothetical protein
MTLNQRFSSILRRVSPLIKLLNSTARRLSPETVFVLDYPVKTRQRWTIDNPHKELYTIISTNRPAYEKYLLSFLRLTDSLIKIPANRSASLSVIEPCWINGWMPALDGVALYGFMVNNNPNIYMEVGSGNSTKFARKAIIDYQLKTKIISIDPCPRDAIDSICDVVIRKPVEEIDVSLFTQLNNNDILYIDNSHRILMNSDATTVFLDVLPKLNPGVFVEFHDIALPFDYSIGYGGERCYSEQYLLAAYLLARGAIFEIVCPNMFISYDKELSSILMPLWQKKEMENVEQSGCSFWLKIGQSNSASKTKQTLLN